MSLNTFYYLAILAEAAYFDFWDDENEQLLFGEERIKAALINDGDGFSETQAEDFINNWAVVAHQPNTLSGFSK